MNDEAKELFDHTCSAISTLQELFERFNLDIAVNEIKLTGSRGDLAKFEQLLKMACPPIHREATNQEASTIMVLQSVLLTRKLQ